MHPCARLAEPAHNRTTALLVRRFGESIGYKYQQALPRRVEQKSRYALYYSRARPALRSHLMLLPRVHVAHSPYSCARRFECHTVLSTSIYLFFAHLPLPERVSRHLLICARAQKPERFFLCYCCSHAYMNPYNTRSPKTITVRLWFFFVPKKFFVLKKFFYNTLIIDFKHI